MKEKRKKERQGWWEKSKCERKIYRREASKKRERDERKREKEKEGSREMFPSNHLVQSTISLISIS